MNGVHAFIKGGPAACLYCCICNQNAEKEVIRQHLLSTLYHLVVKKNILNS